MVKIIKAIFGFFLVFLGFFVGKTQRENNKLNETLKNVRKAKQIDSDISALSDPELDRKLQKYGRKQK